MSVETFESPREIEQGAICSLMQKGEAVIKEVIQAVITSSNHLENVEDNDNTSNMLETQKLIEDLAKEQDSQLQQLERLKSNGLCGISFSKNEARRKGSQFENLIVMSEYKSRADNIGRYRH